MSTWQVGRVGGKNRWGGFGGELLLWGGGGGMHEVITASSSPFPIPHPPYPHLSIPFRSSRDVGSKTTILKNKYDMVMTCWENIRGGGRDLNRRKKKSRLLKDY